MKYLLPFVILFFYFITAYAQAPTEQRTEIILKDNSPPDIRPGTAENPIMSAVRLPEGATITLDGFIDEGVWQVAPVATEFTQRNPNDGQSASERTEVRILYTDNAVFRWEYRPGSTLFFVWQQQQSDFEATGDFHFGRDMGELFRSKPTNVILVKASYWFG